MGLSRGCTGSSVPSGSSSKSHSGPVLQSSASSQPLEVSTKPGIMRLRPGSVGKSESLIGSKAPSGRSSTPEPGRPSHAAASALATRMRSSPASPPNSTPKGWMEPIRSSRSCSQASSMRGSNTSVISHLLQKMRTAQPPGLRRSIVQSSGRRERLRLREAIGEDIVCRGPMAGHWPPDRYDALSAPRPARRAERPPSKTG